MSDKPFEIIPYGDAAFLVKFQTDGYSKTVTQHIHSVIAGLKDDPNWEELVPGYNSLLACFCPASFPPPQARLQLLKSLKSLENNPLGAGEIIDIPVCYGSQYGPDMSVIEKSSGLSAKQIIKTHSTPVYSVCMMGFIPGFTFLSEAPKILHHPRHATPRQSVPAGSVGIAGWQTGMYGLESPGGWQIIGRTPYSIFDAHRDTPFLLKAGDRVRFQSISPREFEELSE